MKIAAAEPGRLFVKLGLGLALLRPARSSIRIVTNTKPKAARRRQCRSRRGP